MKITTRNGYTFQVDPEDEKLAREKGWYAKIAHRILANGEPTKSGIYIARRIKGSKNHRKELLHRLILNAPEGIPCDHINMDTLDNRRSNLRLCNNSQNAMNCGLRADNTSGHRGIDWSRRHNRWRARIFIEGKELYLGEFRDRKLACLIYDQAASYFFGEFARLNFPKESHNV